MSTRGRSLSPRPNLDQDVDMDVDSKPTTTKSTAKVVIITNLSRNVVETHLKTIFGFYGDIVQIDLPVFGKSGQNRGKAALEYVDPPSAQKAASHMNGGQIDGAVIKVELSELPVRSRSQMDTPDLDHSLGPALGRARPQGLGSVEEMAPGMALACVIRIADVLSAEVARRGATSTAEGAHAVALVHVLQFAVRQDRKTAWGLGDAHRAISVSLTLEIHIAFPFPLTFFLFVILPVQPEQEPFQVG
ncbi:hypothetical protein C8R44DRAFT_752452 [Mycena epipterygia]|nr:hypothetical protein C8R44DRAFT_752452 [Mycena epipterygia]